MERLVILEMLPKGEVETILYIYKFKFGDQETFLLISLLYCHKDG